MRSRYTTITIVFGLSLLLVACSSHDESTYPEDLTNAAWAALKEKPKLAIKKAQACIDLYEDEAIDQQNAITAAPPVGKVTPDQKATTFENWALNNVGTCYYILGQAFSQLGRTDEARRAYQKAQQFPHARAWDPGGWFWSPAEAAGKKLAILR